MKIRLISTIVLIVMFFAVTDISYCEDEQKCQPDVIVFFGNGVGIHREATDKNRILLQIRLNKHISGTSLDGIITYELAYNPSEGALADLLETFEQNFQTEKSKFWRFLAGLDLMPDILQDKLKEIATEINADIVSTNPSVQEHIAVYDQYLSEGNVVVLVAHSQGNLYGNIAYLGLDQQYIDGFGIVSVANPDSYVAGEERYTTIEEDYIISPLQYVYPYALPPNLDNFLGPVNLNDWSGHKFIESYMAAGHAAETVILDNVVNMINELSEPLSSCDTTSCIDFTADVVSGSSPLTVQFTVTPDPDSNIDNWLWDFGDGNFSAEQNPTNIYTADGVYTVVLTAWDETSSSRVPWSSSTFHKFAQHYDVHQAYLNFTAETFTPDIQANVEYTCFFNGSYTYRAGKQTRTWDLSSYSVEDTILIMTVHDSRRVDINESAYSSSNFPVLPPSGTWEYIPVQNITGSAGQIVSNTVQDANGYQEFVNIPGYFQKVGWGGGLYFIFAHKFSATKCEGKKEDYIYVGDP